MMSIVVIFLRWVRTSALRIASALYQGRWIVLSMILAALGIIGVVVALPMWLSIFLGAVSLVLLVLEIRDHVTSLRELEFTNRSDEDYGDVRRAIQRSARFRFVNLRHGYVIVDSVASREVAAGAVTAVIQATGYVAPPELREVGAAFRRQRVAEGATYNGRVLGLDTDIGVSDQIESVRWALVAARYWDHLGSDIMATKDPIRRGNVIPGLGRSLFVNRAGMARDFHESWLLNAVGTSVIAITTDARLVVVSQSVRNESSRGLLAPSASGSLEAQDFRGAASIDIAQLAINGALRELSEEAAISETEVVEQAFLRFVRWLDKAAKPEFLAIARLSIDSHAVRRKVIPPADRPYTTNVDVLRLHRAFINWRASNLTSIIDCGNDESVIGRLSVPLEASIREMAVEVGDPMSPAGAVIRSAMEQ